MVHSLALYPKPNVFHWHKFHGQCAVMPGLPEWVYLNEYFVCCAAINSVMGILVGSSQGTNPNLGKRNTNQAVIRHVRKVTSNCQYNPGRNPQD